MPRRHVSEYVLIIFTFIFIASSALGGELKPVQLPSPRTGGGMPLMEALKNRQTGREFSPKKLPSQLLSDLLWAGFGVNRPDTNHRTAPSAMNSQEVDIYVARADGVWLYDAKAHRLQPVHSGDIRTLTGGQSYVKEAPLALIFRAAWAVAAPPTGVLRLP